RGRGSRAVFASEPPAGASATEAASAEAAAHAASAEAASAETTAHSATEAAAPTATAEHALDQCAGDHAADHGAGARAASAPVAATATAAVPASRVLRPVGVTLRQAQGLAGQRQCTVGGREGGGPGRGLRAREGVLGGGEPGPGGLSDHVRAAADEGVGFPDGAAGPREGRLACRAGATGGVRLVPRGGERLVEVAVDIHQPG